MVYVIHVMLTTASGIRKELQFRRDAARKLSVNLYDTYHCCVCSSKLLMIDKRNCPKHVEFYFKNKFEKVVHLFGFVIRIAHKMLTTLTGCRGAD